MSRGEYTHIEAMEAMIIATREAGHTNREIADYLGLEKR